MNLKFSRQVIRVRRKMFVGVFGVFGVTSVELGIAMTYDGKDVGSAG
jgi:hypothetical protein